MELSPEIATRLQTVAIQFVPFVMAVVFHEYAHGFIAYKYGDKTAYEQGRMTLNPVPHIDPLGTIVFPLLGMLSGISFLFGWAKPVPINPTRFKEYRKGLFWVSLAGAGMNFLLAIVSSMAYCALRAWAPADFYLYEPLLGMCVASITLNFALGIFNLIPIPPLDGSKVVQSFLPYEAARKYESIAQYSFFIVMALLISGAFQILAYPVLFLSKATLTLMALLFNLPVEIG
ncbi:site-2 protease family protein [bacterium]|jgi:Zn-dependent protease|nr:site-2 protease family protein [bacterium]